MKRAFLLILSIVFLSTFLFFVNLNYVLNTSLFKSFLANVLKTKYHIERFSYKDVKVSLKANSLHFKDLKVSAKHFSVYIKDVHAKIAFKKFFYFKNPIESLYVKEGRLIYTYHSTKKASTYKLPSFDHLDKFFSFEPLHLKFSKLKLLLKEPGKTAVLGSAKGELRFENGQLLFSGSISNGEVLKEIALKGRFNYASSFLETSLLVKEIDLGQIPRLKKIFSKTKINLQARLALEKQRLDLLFFGKAPKVIFKGLPAKLYSCTYFQGLGYFQNGTFEIKIDPIELSFPKTKARLTFSKDKQNYKFLLKVPFLRAEEVLPVVELFLPERVLPYFKAVKKGEVIDFKLSAQSPVLKTLFHLQNLSLKGEVKDGKYVLPLAGEIPFSNFCGTLVLEKGDFQVKGRTEVKDVAEISEGHFELKKEKGIELGLTCRIKGPAERIKSFVLSHWQVLQPLARYKAYGKADFIFQLTYKKHSLKLGLKTLSPIKASLPQIKGVVEAEGFSLKYEPDFLIFKLNHFYHQDATIQNIEGKIDFKTSLAEIHLRKGSLSKKFLKSFFNPHFPKEVDYNFSKLSLKDLVYKGPLSFDLAGLRFKGKLHNFSLKVKRKALLKIRSPSIFFEMKDKSIAFSSSKVILGRSSFKIKGRYKKAKIMLSGNGTLLDKDLKTALNFWGIKALDLREPVKVLNFHFEKSGSQFFYNGTHQLKNLIFFTLFNGTKDRFQVVGRLYGNQTDLSCNFKKGAVYRIESKGKIALKEFSFLFPGIKLNGTVISDLAFSFETPSYEIKKLIGGYLTGEEQIDRGFIDAKDVEIDLKNGLNLGLNFKLKVYPWGLKISPVNIDFKGHVLKGDLSVKKMQGTLLFGGELHGSLLDFRGLSLAKKRKSYSLWKFVKKLPVSGSLKLSFSQVILPSYHRIKDINLLVKYFEGGSFFISLERAKFCTLNLKGFLDYSPEYKYVFLKILPSSGDFLDLFSCLYPKEMPRVLLEGPFEAKGFIYSDGEKSLWEHPYGELVAISKKGYLYRAPLLVKVLGFLSPIDIFKGKIPNLENDLLEYDDLEFKGIVEDSHLRLEEFFLSAPGFRLFGEGKINFPWSNKRVDLTFYVSPFKTLDVILGKVPIIRRLLGKTRMLIYLPVEVVGTYEHPKIVPLHPKSLGKGLSEFFLRFFGLSPKPLSNSKESQILQKIEKQRHH